MEQCKNCQDKTPACIPFFSHENAMMHYNRVNKRMMIILIAVCITFVLTTVIFVTSNTIREKQILETMYRLIDTPAVEVQDGLHQQPD